MKSLNLILILAISAFFFFVFSNNQVDPDLWGHLKFGQDTFYHRQIPQYDTYSYSSFGAPWINHEWLAELIFFLIFKIAHSAGLIIFKFFAGLAITFLIFWAVAKGTKSIYLRLICMALPLSLICSGFAIRPQIFTYVFFTLLLFLISKFESSSDERWLYPLPFIFLLWVNLHGGFVIGIGLVLLYSLFKAAEKRLSRGLLVLIFASALATLINPYGVKIWPFVVGAVLKPRPFITEWTRVKFTLEYLNYFVLCAVALCGLLFSKRRRSYFEAAVMLVSIYFSFQHNRHIVLSAIAVGMFSPKYLDSLFGEWFTRIENSFPKINLKIILAALSAFFILNVFLSGRRPFEMQIPADKFPLDAVRFMKQNHISGNIFPAFDWAQMCIGELAQQNKVFFDGRYETVYGDNVVDGYFNAIYNRKDYKELLKRFPGTDIMFLKKIDPLSAVIENDPEWIRVYSAGPAYIFLKKNENNRKAIEDFKKGKFIYPEESPLEAADLKVTPF